MDEEKPIEDDSAEEDDTQDNVAKFEPFDLEGQLKFRRKIWEKYARKQKENEEAKRILKIKKSQKILIMGLPLAGKTTIHHYIGKHRIINSTTATIDYQRYTLVIGANELHIFELAGQPAFFDRFIGELAEFIFSGVKTVIFVLDPTDTRDLKKVKDRLDLILKRLQQYSPKASVFIFQHKLDLVPKEEQNQTRKKIHEYLIQGHPNSIVDKIHYHETSIHSYSIVRAVDAVMRWALDNSSS